MTTALVAILVLGVAVGLLAVRILFVDGGEFRGTCASNNPYLRPYLAKDADTCWCGKSDPESVDDCEYRTR